MGTWPPVQIGLFSDVPEVQRAVHDYITLSTPEPAARHLIIAHNVIPQILQPLTVHHRFEQEGRQGRNPTRGPNLPPARPYLFVPIGNLAELPLAGTEILVYEPRIIPQLAGFRPAIFTLFMRRWQLPATASTAPEQFQEALNFNHCPGFKRNYSRGNVAILHGTAAGLSPLPFPDAKHIHPDAWTEGADQISIPLLPGRQSGSLTIRDRS
jgi:hypothetical protein